LLKQLLCFYSDNTLSTDNNQPIKTFDCAATSPAIDNYHD